MRQHTYTNLTEEEYRAFGDFVRRAGFPTKSAYFTAVVRVSIYRCHRDYHTPSEKLDPTTLAWIQHWKNSMTAEDELRQTYFDVLTELAFPVIASRGGQLAFHLLQTEIECEMADRTGTIPPYEQMKTWTQVYETIHAEELGRHRADLARDAARETERLRQQEDPYREHEVIYE
ncbi:MAG TPA: hypothetical protein O0Y06_08825 [Methanocorpusculum sp.]|nr:hypothetical protein [Methanocorpusculum sp.]HJK80989.1 hypothetical protein [Methanocorpusculum sp.]